MAQFNGTVPKTTPNGNNFHHQVNICLFCNVYIDETTFRIVLYVHPKATHFRSMNTRPIADGAMDRQGRYNKNVSKLRPWYDGRLGNF